MSEFDESHSDERESLEDYGSDYPRISDELADRGMSIHDFI
ncbi:hypothetical protein [Paenibacillus sp. 7523-1]|nr:hypothetical protein [Paenibacillus sp. 7523-1]